MAIPETGKIQDTPLPRLLIDLHRARFSGSLRLERGRLEKRFLLQEGVPIYAESNLASESLGVQLLDAGRITREDHVRVSERMRNLGCREGKALLELGLIDPKGLFLALKEQVRARLLDCFGWPDGGFQLDPGDPPPPEAQPFRADLYPLVQEGIETHWSADRILTDLGERMEQYPKRTSRLSRIQPRLRDDEAVIAFVDSLTGRKTLWEALQGARSSRALAAAWVLDAAAAIEYRSSPPASEGAPLPDIEILFTDAVDGGDASRKAKPSARRRTPAETPDAAGDVEPSEEALALAGEIEGKFGRLKELDHYQLLGVDPNADVADIKRAYLLAARSYHPDALARARLDPNVRTRASQVFAAIGRAHAVLSDPKRRREYDAALADEEPDLDVNRLAQAERFFRKGEILLRQGNFKGSLDFLRPAVDLWPEEAAYQSALGWALYKKMPSEPVDARQHLERAVALDAKDAVAVFRLSVVLRALGETVAAKAAQDRAARLDPSVRSG